MIEKGGEEDQDLEQIQLPKHVMESKPEETVSSKVLMEIPDKFTLLYSNQLSASIESIEYLTDNSYLAVGCADGTTKVLSTSKGDIQYILTANDLSPITAISANRNQQLIKNALMLTHSDGTLEYWHATSKQLLFSKNYSENIQTCEISCNGLFYGIAIGAGGIRIGHLSKGDPSEVVTGHLGNHDNRVFCLKWSPLDENILISGGWDKAVHFWDVRTRLSVQTIFGHYIGGEAIDIKSNGDILLGSNQNYHELTIFDWKAQKVRPIQWPLTSESQRNSQTGVLSCAFSKNERIIACTAKRELRLFEGEACVSEMRWDSEERIFAMCPCPGEEKVAIGYSNGLLQIYDY